MLELIQASAGIDDNQKWLEILSEVGASHVRMRQGSGNRPSIEKIETSLGTSYKMTGVLNTTKVNIDLIACR